MTAPVIPDQATANASVNISKRSADDVALGYVSRILRDRGFYDGPDTAALTPRLEEAVMLYQQAAGIEPNGMVTKDFVSLLNDMPELRVKAVGMDLIRISPKDEVHFVRSFLTEQGYAVSEGRSNRVDPSMKSAISAFQSQNGLRADGRISTSLLAQITKLAY
jgi:peptidoglycan hydrolase-like protein with peptidoglycan-binding domain